IAKVKTRSRACPCPYTLRPTVNQSRFRQDQAMLQSPSAPEVARRKLDLAREALQAGDARSALALVRAAAQALGLHGIAPSAVAPDMPAPQAPPDLADLAALFAAVSLQADSLMQHCDSSVQGMTPGNSRQAGLACPSTCPAGPYWLPPSQPPQHGFMAQAAQPWPLQPSLPGCAYQATGVAGAGPAPQAAGPDPNSSDMILMETGRQGIADCSLGDGSSYVCSRCGGVVACARRQQHEECWCMGMG
ncbi:hypothetical protein QJQ45_016186, partial [Haematococcus lacustris]